MESTDESSNSSSQSSRHRSSKDRNGKNKSAKARAGSSAAATAQDDKIEQICSITGNPDKTVAQNLLEACDGNLEMAINMALENAGPSSGAANPEEEDFVRAPIPQKQEVLVQSHEGYGFGFKGKRRVIKSVFDSFRNFEAETRLQEARLRNHNGHEEASAESSKKKSLEDLFRPPIDIMFKGNLQLARDVATTNKKWLMVNIQNVTEFACQVLNRDVWSHPAIKDLVREHFIFLQLYADSEEGERYTMFYKVNQWPYIGILDPRTGECLCTWNNVDHITCADLISEFLLTNTLDDKDDGPDAKRRRHEKTLLDESEDAQLEAAIKASLTETKQQTEVEEDSDYSEEDLESFHSDSEQLSEPSVDKTVEEATSPETPSNDWKIHLGPDTDPKSTIVFRFPDGRKEQCVFPCTSSILCLLKYVAGQGFPCERFELMANFPKRQISTMEAKTTLKEAGLYPQDTPIQFHPQFLRTVSRSARIRLFLFFLLFFLL